MTEIIRKLIRIYTPFICALMAIVNGVLFILDYSGIIYRLLSEFTGHSFLLIMYILATSKRMCVWYKATTWLLLLIHIPNTLYYYHILQSTEVIYIGIVINILALITFLIYRVSVGITKILC